MVSCVTKEGIKELQERIHAAALNAKDPDTHEHVIGMQVRYKIHTHTHSYIYIYVHPCTSLNMGNYRCYAKTYM